MEYNCDLIVFLFCQNYKLKVNFSRIWTPLPTILILNLLSIDTKNRVTHYTRVYLRGLWTQTYEDIEIISLLFATELLSSFSISMGYIMGKFWEALS